MFKHDGNATAEKSRKSSRSEDSSSFFSNVINDFKIPAGKKPVNWRVKAISVLMITFSILLFFSLVSYSPLDEANAQISFFDLFGLFTGDALIIAKAETSRNLLGLLGAYLSNIMVNRTVGYIIILLPFFLIFWSIGLFRGNIINRPLMRKTAMYFLTALLFAGFMGTISSIQWLPDLSKEWMGAIGMYLTNITSAIIGKAGAFILYFGLLSFMFIWVTGMNLSSVYDNSKNWISEQLKKTDFKFRMPSMIKFNKNSEDKNEVQEQDVQKTEEHIQSETQKEPEETKESTDIPSKPTDKPRTNDVPITFIRPSSTVENTSLTDEPARLIRQQFDPGRDSKQVKPKTGFNQDYLNQYENYTDSDNAQHESIQKADTQKDLAPNSDAKSEQPVEPPDNWQETKQELETSPLDAKSYLNEYKSKLKGNVESKPSLEKQENDIETVESNNQISASDNNQNDNKDIEDKKLTISVKEQPKDQKEPKSPISTAIHDEKIHYIPPVLDILNTDIKEDEINEEELKNNAKILQEKLETFKIFIENLSVTPGPVVTQYEFIPAPGIKISKIENLADDLAMALKAKGIRIIAPIPGKGTVGIEIPNSKPNLVRFSDVINSAKFRETPHKLPLALGKTISGDIYIEDLAKMPHLLIAGSTGSGKSVGINTIISSLLYKKRPDELKFVIIDPKKVELQQYSALRDHFLAVSPDIESEIITDPKDAVIVLKAVVAEMENRYDILSEIGQRNIKDYNRKVKQGNLTDQKGIAHRVMPYIVVIVDELADLMLTASKEIEEPITRLAQMSRAVGIHLVIATQRPSVNVITGLIKANFPARMAYLVASKIDSRTILDLSGAEQLLGNGDMLCLPPGKPKPIRVQNSFIDTDEVEELCEYIGSQTGYSEPYWLPSLVEKSDNNEYDPSDRDELFEDAARIIIQQQQGSVSLLQRKLKIGYARAGRIVDELESAGVVGPFTGSKARDVLMESESELESVL